MHTPTLRQLSACLTLAAGLALAGTAQAALMQYTYQANASGQLNGQSFINTAVTVTLTGDTDAVYSISNFAVLVPALTTLIEVAGIGSDSFAQPITAVSNFRDGYHGFGEPVSDTGIFFVEHVSAMSYFLATPLGLVSGEASGNPGMSFKTMGGSFTYDSFDSAGTFEAALAQVPEPGSWALLLAGLAVVGHMSRRHAA